MRMQSLQLQFSPRFDAPDGIDGLAAFDVKPETAPLRVDSRVHVQTDGDGDGNVQFGCDFFQVIDLIEGIDMDLCPSLTAVFSDS